MTDREMLEFAAKAADLELFDGVYGDKLRVYYTCPHTRLNRYAPWNPLTDDGDALRLAVRCAQLFGFYRFLRAWLIAMATEQGSPSDPCAATRRAIVRAAAEIGKAQSAARIGRQMP